MRKILEQCPTCGGTLEITRLKCTSCETTVKGHYHPCPFCSLSPESTRFLLTFVRCRGNVKEMERELGISYWTVRRRLDGLSEELGVEAAVETEDVTALQLDVLEQVSRGELDATAAAKILAQMSDDK